MKDTLLPTRILLTDLQPELIVAWQQEFASVEGVEIRERDFFDEPADAVVSPANSFGFMDGGLDLVIRSQLHGIEAAVQQVIVERHRGELPVGYAEVVASSHAQWPFVVCAPTMRVPENVSDTLNPYLATRAALLAVVRFNEGLYQRRIASLVIPGMGTGVGRVAPQRCAAQMRLAYDSLLIEGNIPSGRTLQAQHLRLLAT